MIVARLLRPKHYLDNISQRRVFVLRRVNINVEFIFVLEDQMTAFNECAHCNAYASQQCSGCNKVLPIPPILPTDNQAAFFPCLHITASDK